MLGDHKPTCTWGAARYKKTKGISTVSPIFLQGTLNPLGFNRFNIELGDLELPLLGNHPYLEFSIPKNLDLAGRHGLRLGGLQPLETLWPGSLLSLAASADTFRSGALHGCG